MPNRNDSLLTFRSPATKLQNAHPDPKRTPNFSEIVLHPMPKTSSQNVQTNETKEFMRLQPGLKSPSFFPSHQKSPR